MLQGIFNRMDLPPLIIYQLGIVGFPKTNIAMINIPMIPIVITTAMTMRLFCLGMSTFYHLKRPLPGMSGEWGWLKRRRRLIGAVWFQQDIRFTAAR